LSLLAFSDSAIQLVPDGTLLFHLALIVIMVALLNVTLLKPINRVLEERERRTKGRMGEAQETLARIDEKMREYRRSLREARGAGYLLLEEERSAASRNREQLVSLVKAEVVRWQEQEKDNLQTAEAAAKAGLIKDAGARAIEIGNRILGRPIRMEKR
jgi:F-type H+-transporting ATPase subunit b